MRYIIELRAGAKLICSKIDSSKEKKYGYTFPPTTTVVALCAHLTGVIGAGGYVLLRRARVQ